MLAQEFLTLFALSNFDKFSDVRIQKAGFLRVDVWREVASLYIIVAEGTRFVYNRCGRSQICI